MSVSDYLGSRKCNLHKPSTPVDYPRPVGKRRCLPAPNNPSVPVRTENRRRDIDNILDQWGREKMWYRFGDYHDWCRHNKIPMRFSRRLVRRFLKSQKGSNANQS